jgi:hypothetical protein
MKLISKTINDFNELIAINMTLAFGTMWMCYAFFLYGFMPLIWPEKMNVIMYWSSTVQLWALPLIMVGTNILGRASERRSQKMYIMIKDEFTELKETHKLALEELSIIRKMCDGCKYQNEK